MFSHTWSTEIFLIQGAQVADHGVPVMWVCFSRCYAWRGLMAMGKDSEEDGGGSNEDVCLKVYDSLVFL